MAGSRYGADEEQKAIWVFLEHNDVSLAKVSLEILSKGRQLADQAEWRLTGFLMGWQAAELAQEAIAYGADEVVLAEHPLLEVFTVDGYTEAAYQVIMQQKPSVFLLGATPDGRDLAGRLAVRLRTGLNADCTDLRLDPGSEVLVSEVSGFGGGVLALIEMQQHRPQMATVRPGVFPVPEPDRPRTGEVVQVPVNLSDDMIQTQVINRVVGQRVDLTQAPVLVVGGRGVEGDFAMLRELAGLLYGDVGATRPPVDDGYIERERQIGQTGVICRPKVAINCGISGAFQYVVGIQEAGLVIAINSDPEAPIFDVADYCVVGDVKEIVPALISALRETGDSAGDRARSLAKTPQTEASRA